MSENGFRISATLKGGDKFSAPWLVFYGNTAAEVSALLDEAADIGLAAVVAQHAASFQGEVNVASGLPTQPGVAVQQTTNPYQQTVSSPAPQVNAYQGPAVAQPAQQGSAGGACAHGPRVLKEGDKNGKHWSGWFCPERGTDCKPVWNKG